MSANGVDSANLLVELFVEELPPKALKKLGEAFASVLTDNLKAQGLASADACVTGYASPRRLAVHLTGVLARAADKPVAHKLMPVAVGLDVTGNATPALLKRLAAIGADDTVIPQLRRRHRHPASRGFAIRAGSRDGQTAHPESDELSAGRRLEYC
jgi:glycyl-tRNA synthetase beta chain